MSKLKLKFSIVILFAASLVLPAQNKSVQDFDSAVKLFKEKKYQTALSLFHDISAKENPNQTAAAYFIIRIYVEQKKFSDAENEAKNFLQKFGASKYADEVNILLIKCLLEQNKYKSAFKQSIELIKSANSQSYKIEAKSIAQRIAKNYLSSYDLKEYLDNENDLKIKPFILYTLSELYNLEGDSDKSRATLKEIVNIFPQTEEYLLAKNSLSVESTKKNEDEVVVGVILPLTDKNGKTNIAAEEMLEGIKYAFHEFNYQRENKIGLLIRDSRRNETDIKKIVDEFNSDNRVRAVIGPVYSDESEIVISKFDNTNLVFISPTATDEDLTENNNQFYQANPPFTVRGKVFAQYIFLKEGKRNLAVLNSLDGYSPILAKSFVDEFQRLGGNIIIKETYRSKSIDFSKQISNLVTHINELDGIYVPISDRNDAEKILSEMLKQNFNVPVYGNQDWINAKGLETSSTITKTLKITSDYFIDYSDESFIKFEQNFQKVTGQEITRNVLYGYDTAKFLVTVLRNIQPVRNVIKMKIDSGLKSNGYHNHISFSSRKRNLYINILSYSDNKFQLVEKYRGTE